MRTLVWFRNDLRVADNPALFHAMGRGEAVAVFCLCNRQWRSHHVGDNRLAFLLDSLHALAADLKSLGVPLRLITEPWFENVPKRLVDLAHRLRGEALAFNVEYPLNERRRDDQVTRACEANGIAVTRHHGGVLMPPGTVLTKEATPYTVFSPFKRRWLSLADPSVWEPLPRPRPQRRPAGVADSHLPDQTDGVGRDHVAARWPAGAEEAARRLERFLSRRIDHYDRSRNFPAMNGTSELSPYLSAGSISARSCVSAAMNVNDGRLRGPNAGVLVWIDELIWRDFYRHVVAFFPHVSRGRAFHRRMDHLPWRHAPEDFESWKTGRTGFPLIDAAMRQLATTGWMHNRLRMLSATFLSKHLLIDWRLGERHFMQLLVDGDFAANNGGWQWSASTGTDAMPYFRIFNPHIQARRFDPNGAFVRRFVPELEDAPQAALFDPDGHAVEGYPRPICDHRAARARALDVFKAVQASRRAGS